VSAVVRDPGPAAAADGPCSVTLRVKNHTLVTLQLLSIEIRHRNGASLSRSAILRALIRWMETCDVDTSEISSPEDLRSSLALALLRDSNT
jgi:hypothetical protein